MKPRRIVIFLSALALIIIAGPGCTKHIAPPKNALKRPAALQAAINTRLSQIKSARFKDIVLDYFGDGQRVKIRQLILVKQPDMLRVQTRIPGTNAIMSLLMTDGEKFAMHNRKTNEYFTGAPTPENISRLLPVDLSARDVVRVMLGGAPWDRFARSDAPAKLSWDDTTGRYLYKKATPSGGTLLMQVRPTDYAVVSVTEKNPAGQVTYHYTTEDWKRVKNTRIALPEYRRFVWPARDLDFSLDVGETQLNPKLPDTLFMLAPPPGSTIIHVK